jgi:hypothetical protein
MQLKIFELLFIFAMWKIVFVFIFVTDYAVKNIRTFIYFV